MGLATPRPHVLVMWKVGYHYTSLSNWEKIQREGYLEQYRLNHPAINAVFGDLVIGVWLWEFNPLGQSHAGNILYQVGTKGEHQIVKLKVLYDPTKVLRAPNGGNLQVRHQGSVGSWMYHKRDKSVIVQQDIPLENIKQEKTYNVIDLLR